MLMLVSLQIGGLNHINLLFLFSLVYFSDYHWCHFRLIGLADREFANGPGDRGSIPGRVIPKTGS